MPELKLPTEDELTRRNAYLQFDWSPLIDLDGPGPFYTALSIIGPEGYFYNGYSHNYPPSASTGADDVPASDSDDIMPNAGNEEQGRTGAHVDDEDELTQAIGGLQVADEDRVAGRSRERETADMHVDDDEDDDPEYLEIMRNIRRDNSPSSPSPSQDENSTYKMLLRYIESKGRTPDPFFTNIHDEDPDPSATVEQQLLQSLRDPHNQCITLFPVRYRSRVAAWAFKLMGQAEPQDPKQHRDNDMSPAVPSLDGSNSQERGHSEIDDYDPLHHLLNYIIEYSDAEGAVAAYEDVAFACKGEPEIPRDFKAYLEKRKPRIYVTSEKLGSLYMECYLPEPVLRVDGEVVSEAEVVAGRDSTTSLPYKHEDTLNMSLVIPHSPSDASLPSPMSISPAKYGASLPPSIYNHLYTDSTSSFTYPTSPAPLSVF
ncbi:hypothetical protein EUX98_g4979 [Antrodiella citrinella]|uniref:Uncharacterized protein n=1 Tax=Antrodiella citrinella TaxID=2447956 RepID=A0A4S4MSW0_9APHY|nr:hypothetical protein EUX98_g4979 [Antrodiella citrinella]